METVKKQVKDLKVGDRVVATVSDLRHYKASKFMSDIEFAEMEVAYEAEVEVVRNTKIEVGCKVQTKVGIFTYTVVALNGAKAWVTHSRGNSVVDLDSLIRID